MSKKILSTWPSFSLEEANAVSEVLLSNRVNYWTGNEGRLFEEEFAQYINTKYAIAVSNGTVALDLALQSLNLNQHDEVIVTSRTFIASVSSIVNSGAKPIFADVDPESQNISAETIAAVLSPQTRAIICVHLAGWPCDMDPILNLASQHNLTVIEDCAQAHGATYKGKPVGSIGDIGCWSFCQDKIMTTGGEGGMVTTDNQKLWSIMWSYKDHGKCWEAVYKRQHSPGFRWLHESFGTNWRMTEMQSAIGRIQLKRMPSWHDRRLANAYKIWDAAKESSLFRVPQIPDHIEHAAYKCYIFVNGNSTLRDRIMDQIKSFGVPCFTGSCSEVYLEKAFEATDFKPESRLSIARQLGDTSLMFLCHPTLSKYEIALICKAIRSISQ